MGKARNLADLLDDNGDVKSASLDNVPASNNASALTTGTLPIARIADDAITNAKLATGITASKLTGALPAISGANLTNLPSDVTVSTSAPGSPSTGDLWFNDTTGVKTLNVYNGTDWNILSNVEFTATGGTITTSGDYTIHTFTSSGTFTPNIDGTVDVLVVAGGGGGGWGTHGGAGGGAGGMRVVTNHSVSSQAYTVTIGAGGAKSTGVGDRGDNGANSVFGSITSLGGGGAGVYGSLRNGLSGGSGGGGSETYQAGSSVGGAGTSGQGNAGGSSSQTFGGGGGGGAGAAGANAVATNIGGAGGVGVANSYSGSSVYYAGGGGGNGDSGGGAGGNGGGGAGAGNVGAASGNGVSGSANTGGGGGACGASGSPGNGGSGIVIVRYLT